MLPNREPLHVLEDKVAGVKFGDETHEIAHKRVARIIENPLADHRESLAGRPTEDDIHRSLADPRRRANLLRVEITDGLGEHRALGN